MIRKEREREMDLFIGNLLNNTTKDYEECFEEFKKVYPKEERYFDEFFLDYVS